MDVYTGVFGQHALFIPSFVFYYKCISKKIKLAYVDKPICQSIADFCLALFIDAIVRYVADGTTAPWWFIFNQFWSPSPLSS